MGSYVSIDVYQAGEVQLNGLDSDVLRARHDLQIELMARVRDQSEGCSGERGLAVKDDMLVGSRRIEETGRRLSTFAPGLLAGNRLGSLVRAMSLIESARRRMEGGYRGGDVLSSRARTIK